MESTSCLYFSFGRHMFLRQCLQAIPPARKNQFSVARNPRFSYKTLFLSVASFNFSLSSTSFILLWFNSDRGLSCLLSSYKSKKKLKSLICPQAERKVALTQSRFEQWDPNEVDQLWSLRERYCLCWWNAWIEQKSVQIVLCRSRQGDKFILTRLFDTNKSEEITKWHCWHRLGNKKGKNLGMDGVCSMD